MLLNCLVCLILIIFDFDIFKIVKKWVIICLIGLWNVNKLKKLNDLCCFNCLVICVVVCWIVKVFFLIFIDLGVLSLIWFFIFW